MKVACEIRHWLAWFSLMLILAAVPSFAQHHGGGNPAPRPSSAKAQARPSGRPAAPPRSQPPQQRGQAARTYQVPSQGHHSGQWLNKHLQQPLDQQKRVLESDPAFRRLPPQRQQQLEQRLQHFDNLPAERQQQILQRMETWEHLTGQQKQQLRSVDSQFRNLPPDRQNAVRNAIQTLRAMPPNARDRAIQSGRFSNFSPQERQILNNAAHLPLAPAPEHAGQPATGAGRYIPRPPQ